MSVVSRATLERYVTTLTAGLEALRKLDEHAEKHAGIPGMTPGVNVCAGCMRYAVQVSLQRRNPRDVLAERCVEAQIWQRRVWAAYELIGEIAFAQEADREEVYGGDDNFASARFDR